MLNAPYLPLPRADAQRLRARASAIVTGIGALAAAVVIGHADSYPDPAYYRAIIERGASLEFDFLGMTFTPVEEVAQNRPRCIHLLIPPA